MKDENDIEIRYELERYADDYYYGYVNAHFRGIRQLILKGYSDQMIIDIFGISEEKMLDYREIVSFAS